MIRALEGTSMRCGEANVGYKYLYLKLVLFDEGLLPYVDVCGTLNFEHNRSALVGRAYIDMSFVVGEEGGEYDFIVDVREEGNNRYDIVELVRVM